MLVVLREHAARYYVPVVRRLPWIDVDDAHDAGGADLECDAAGSVELVCENVLVVGERDDELNN